MISFGGVVLKNTEKIDKSGRTRQVQFRIEPEKLKALRIAIINDDNIHSMADLFNKAVDEYLTKRGMKNEQN
jgi:hypothetical protein